MDFLHRLLDRLDLLIAGLFGVIVASWWHKDDLTDWWAWMIFLITGVSCSLYLTGMVSAYLGVTEPSIVAGIGFLLGTFGVSVQPSHLPNSSIKGDGVRVFLSGRDRP